MDSAVARPTDRDHLFSKVARLVVDGIVPLQPFVTDLTES
jgi:hypothetical protein